MKKLTSKPSKTCTQSANESALSDLKHAFQNVRTKADVRRAILHEEVLRRIPIEQAPNVSKEQAEKDFRRERVILNGVFFIPDKVDTVRCETFALSLHHLVERLQMQENNKTNSTPSSSSSKSSIISDTILQRGCRTSAGADSFFMVQKLLCIDGTFITQKTSLRAEDPIIVDVFLMYDERDLDADHAYSAAAASNQQLSSSSGSTNSTIDHPSEASQYSSCISNQCGEMLFSKDACQDQDPDNSMKCSADNTGKEVNLVNSDRMNATENAKEGFCGVDNGSLDTSQTLGSLYARIEVKNFFSVYDISAMDELPSMPEAASPGMCGGSAASLTLDQPLPWLEVETILIDESNFRTKEHWRRLQLIVTEMAGQHPATATSSSSYSVPYRSP
jgi:hypothetical protein